MTDENQGKAPKWVKAPQGVFETYSNQTHLSWSFDDVSLRFAQLGQLDVTPGTPLSSINVERAAITISWRVAKVLSLQLAQIIKNYEKVNGEITLKPQLASSEGT